VDTDGDFSAYAGARWGALVRSAVVLGCSLQDAQDLVQTTLIKCYVGWPAVAQAGNRDAYVYRMLLNSYRDSRRRRWWGERATEQLPDFRNDDLTGEVDVADAVHRALSDLPKAQREVVVLRYLAHLTEQQTASILNVAPGTVKSRLSRALTQLSTNPHLSDLTEGQSS
jgi:RNA polymerase sigma-70 factor (sigma-E family)